MSETPAPGRTFDEIQALFESLDIQTFEAALPEGRITWLDSDGQPVAHARCKAILSHASANDTLVWARGLEHFVEAGVPMVEVDEELPDLMENVPRETAEQFAMRFADRDGAEFYYEAPAGEGSILYLAIHEFGPIERGDIPDA